MLDSSIEEIYYREITSYRDAVRTLKKSANEATQNVTTTRSYYCLGGLRNREEMALSE